MKRGDQLAGLSAALLSLAGAMPVCADEALPAAILNQLPPGHEILASARGRLDDDGLDDYLIALGAPGENEAVRQGRAAPPRPLLIFTQRPEGGFRLARRNDQVVMRADQGGQCDPFLDSDERLVINKHYFTVQNSVACGQHWQWFVTFHYDRGHREWLFHKAVFESWVLNSSGQPDAEALIPGHGRIHTARTNPALPFAKYRQADLR